MNEKKLVCRQHFSYKKINFHYHNMQTDKHFQCVTEFAEVCTLYKFCELKFNKL